jgi:VWFA-related protein
MSLSALIRTANSVTKKFALVVAAILLCALASIAASPEIQPVKINKLNVVALDAQGRPVTGLRTADLQILEDGKPQSIALLRFTGDPPLLNLVKRGPGEYSNRAVASPHVTVMLVDLLNEPLISETIIGREVADSLKDLESSDGVYLYLLTFRGELRPIHPLPKPDSGIAPPAESWTRNIVSTLQAALKDLAGLRPVNDLDIRSRFDLTMDALRDLASQLAQASGRKNLVWVTGGIPMIGFSAATQSGMDFSNRVRWFSERLEQSQIVVYTVQTTAGAAVAETLDEVTAITGGREYSSSRAVEAIQQAITDSRANYEIDYYSAPAASNRKHRKVRVICGRSGARLQTAHEFYAVPPKILPNGFTVEEFHSRELPREIDTAIHSPFDATEIGIRASASPGSSHAPELSTSVTRRTEFEIHIDAADLLPRSARDHGARKVSVAFAACDEELRPSSAPILYDLMQDQLDAGTNCEIELHYTIPVGRAIPKVRVIVFDEELDAVGSVTIPIRH